MSSDETQRHTVTVSKQFAADVCEHYPAATSVAQALAMAAQDGVTFRESFNSDLKRYIRMTVRETTIEELENKDGPE